jgi:hypothetical protein
MAKRFAPWQTILRERLLVVHYVLAGILVVVCALAVDANYVLHQQQTRNQMSLSLRTPLTKKTKHRLLHKEQDEQHRLQGLMVGITASELGFGRLV